MRGGWLEGWILFLQQLALVESKQQQNSPPPPRSRAIVNTDGHCNNVNTVIIVVGSILVLAACYFSKQPPSFIFQLHDNTIKERLSFQVVVVISHFSVWMLVTSLDIMLILK